MSIVFEDLGRLGYTAAFEKQRAVHERVLAGDAPPTILFVEHDPVITVSQRRTALQHVLASQHQLRMLGIDVQPTDRGGDVTYHGPGQLVAYPILRLADVRFNVGRYIRFLEEVIMATVAAFGVQAHQVPGCTGVWVNTQGPNGSTAAKLAAIGVRVKRNVTLHGLALNVTTNLSHFDTIVPCGLANRNVASLASLLGEACPTFAAVRQMMAQVFRERYEAARQAVLANANH